MRTDRDLLLDDVVKLRRQVDALRSVVNVRGSQEVLIEALASLDVGQSIFVPAYACKTPAAYVTRVSKASGAKFTTRKAEEKDGPGHRIWRFA